MMELARKDDRVVAVTAAMPEGTGLSKFAKKYPDRFFDVGIAEQHGVTFAAGMASEGYRPVVAIYSTFLQRAYDQIVHDVCLEALPVIFMIDRGGLVGEDGPTHHGQFDLTYLRNLPNMVVMSPKDENELQAMMLTALSHDGPIAMRYPRGTGLGVDLDPAPQPIPIGKAELIRSGKDLLILAVGRMVAEGTNAAIELDLMGIQAAVVNCRFVKPLDSDLLLPLCSEIPNILILEENSICGGFGSAILELLGNHHINPRHIERIGLPDQFIEHGSASHLREKYGLTTTHIVQKARLLVSGD
jgi:1-deoxy-D-xylulose-5-phosphate synthase